MTAEVPCAWWTWAKRPEDGEFVVVLCERAPCHDVPHHGHLFYDCPGGRESRCVEWIGGLCEMPGGQAPPAH